MNIDFYFDLQFLIEAAALVDGRLEQLDREANESPDPDSYGVYDRGEYMIGFGFVACQTYVTGGAKLGNRKDVLELGPRHPTGQTIVKLISAAANHWKHSPEWCLDAPSTRAQKTLEVIASLGVNTHSSYPVANMLGSATCPGWF